MKDSSSRGRWVALVTGVFSILIGVIYLVLITLLDSRGQMLPPPPEALAVLVTVAVHSLEGLQFF